MTGNNIGSACGACKFLRRKCTNECVFAPYFSYSTAVNHFAAVHKVFGASNASKLLLNLPLERRSDAAVTITYEALARLHNPVFGCVAHIFALQNQVESLTEEIEMIGNQLAATIQESNYMRNNNNYFYDNNIYEQLEICNNMNLHNAHINQDTSFLDQQASTKTEPMASQQLPQLNCQWDQAFIDRINYDTDMDTLHAESGREGQITYPQNPRISHDDVGFQLI